MRIIAAAEVEAALDYPSLVERLRQAFRRDIHVPVPHHHGVEAPDGRTTSLLLMPASPIAPHIGVQMVTVFPAPSDPHLRACTGINPPLHGNSGTCPAHTPRPHTTA